VAHPADVERVYREQASKLWRSLLAWSGSAEVATEAVSEAFAQAIRRGESVRDVEAWVWRSAFKIATGELGRRAPPVSIGDRAVLEAGFERAEEADRLLRALARLPNRQRAVLVLRFYADLNLSEIARTLAIAYPTAGVHLSQGKRRLKELLEQEGEG